MKNLSKFEDFVNEGSLKGSKGHREFQMSSMTTGIRESSVFLNERDGKIEVKVSAWSGGSDGFKVPMPAKMDQLSKEIRASYRTNDPEVVKRGEEAHEEMDNLKETIQAEIFDAVVKELEAVDAKIEKAIMSILKKY